MSLGVAHGEKFEFQGKQYQPPILRNLRIVLAQSAQALRRIVVPPEQGVAS